MTGLDERCRQVLEGSWTTGEREGVAFAYTRPSPGRYRWQWYWDSCFAAIAWRHFDPARSRTELETLLAAARPDLRTFILSRCSEWSVVAVRG